MDTDALLAERSKTHGDYSETADTIQRIKQVFQESRNWEILCPVQRESLDMIANKVGRVLSGDPNEPDHWDDVAGYARLVANYLRKLFTHKE